MKTRETTLLLIAAALLGGASWSLHARVGLPRTGESPDGVAARAAPPSIVAVDRVATRAPVVVSRRDSTGLAGHALTSAVRGLRVEVHDRSGIPVVGADVTLTSRGVLMRATTDEVGVVVFPADGLRSGSVRAARSGRARHVTFDVVEVRAGTLAIELAP